MNFKKIVKFVKVIADVLEFVMVAVLRIFCECYRIRFDHNRIRVIAFVPSCRLIAS